MAMIRSGCCVDGACTDTTCMRLPGGVTCGGCANFQRCAGLFGAKKERTVCDWFPRRYRGTVPGPVATG